LGRRDSTIIREWRAWSNEGSERRRKDSGRPRITNERQERRLRRLASVNPFETTRSVEVTWRLVLEKQVSMRTIYRGIRSHGLAHNDQLIEWCTLREHWIDEWHQIIFSDESRFCLWQSDGRLRVRRPRGQRLNLQFALRRHSGLTPGVMVWGAIQFRSRSPLVFIQGSLECSPVHQRSFGTSFVAISSKASQQCFSARQR
jgi:hypothetical protein